MKNCLLFLILIGCQSLVGQNIDLRILKAVNKNDRPLWDKTMHGFSNSVNPLIPVTCTGIWVNGYATKDEAMMRNAYKSAITIGFAALTSSTLKYCVNRARPKKKHPDEIMERYHAGRYSFPSGHTTSAFAIATSLTLSYQKWYVAVPTYMYAGIAAYSRMRLGLHFPSDVLGGMVIGIGTGFLVWQLDRTFNGK